MPWKGRTGKSYFRGIMNPGIINVAAPRFGCSLRYSKLRFFEGDKTNSGTLALKYIISGDARYAWEGKEVGLKQGSYLLIPGDCTYHTSFKGNQPIEGLCINLHMDFFTSVYTSLRCSGTELLERPGEVMEIDPAFFAGAFPCGQDAIGPVLSLAARTARGSGVIEDGEELYYNIAAGLIHSQAAINLKLQNIKADKPSTRQDLFRRILLATAYIQDNYSMKMSVEDLAHLAQMSPFHFMRVFRQVMNTTVHQYILHIRLEQAMLMIKERKQSLTSIAQLTGFPDLPSFSKAFRKKFGCTPGKARA
jgi:AraC family transcriptional regulator